METLGVHSHQLTNEALSIQLRIIIKFKNETLNRIERSSNDETKLNLDRVGETVRERDGIKEV